MNPLTCFKKKTVLILICIPFLCFSQKRLPAKPPANQLPILGKYGCTANKYRNGSYEYQPRGFFTLEKGGKYTYLGFKEKSTGTYQVDNDGNLFFKGGYFNGGKAEKTDRPNKFFLVFPTIPDNRWTCGLVDNP